MIKLMMLVPRRSDMDFEAFRDHYEKRHAPLAEKKLGYLKRYVRNYLPPIEGQPTPPCDCITELWFEDMEALRLQGEVSKDDLELRADEDRFMDRSRVRTFIVEEQESEMP